MINGYREYITHLLLFSIPIAFLAVLLDWILPDKYTTESLEFIGLFIFFIAFTAILHYFLMWAANISPQQFIRAFTGLVAVKMMLFLGGLLLYKHFSRETFPGFAIAFLFLYGFFMVFEAVALYRHFRKNPGR